MRDILSQSLDELHRQINAGAESEPNQESVSDFIILSDDDLAEPEITPLSEIRQSAMPIFITRIERILGWLKHQFYGDENRERDFLVGFVEGLALSHDKDLVLRHCAAVAGDQEGMKYAIHNLNSGVVKPEQRFKLFMKSISLLLLNETKTRRVGDFLNGIITGLLLCHPMNRVHWFINYILLKEWPDLLIIANNVLDTLLVL